MKGKLLTKLENLTGEIFQFYGFGAVYFTGVKRGEMARLCR